MYLVMAIVEACHLLRGGGGKSNNVHMNVNFVLNSSNHHYSNKLADMPINIAAVLERASISFSVMSPKTRMGDQARVHVSQMLVSKEDQPMIHDAMDKETSAPCPNQFSRKMDNLVSLIGDTQH